MRAVEGEEVDADADADEDEACASAEEVVAVVVVVVPLNDARFRNPRQLPTRENEAVTLRLTVPNKDTGESGVVDDDEEEDTTWLTAISAWPIRCGRKGKKKLNETVILFLLILFYLLLLLFYLGTLHREKFHLASAFFGFLGLKRKR